MMRALCASHFGTLCTLVRLALFKTKLVAETLPGYFFLKPLPPVAVLVACCSGSFLAPCCDRLHLLHTLLFFLIRVGHGNHFI